MPAPVSSGVDVIVIGAGPTGENLAQYAHEGGLSVAMVEEALVGGECSYYACMPSKALLRPVALADTSRHLPGLVPASLDGDALRERRDEWVSHYDDSSQAQWAAGAGIGLVRGRARITGERQVTVDQNGSPTILQARVAVVVATGSLPVVPEPLAGLCPWTSRDATGVVEVPERLVVVGGGVVAAEAATWLTAMGSHVTLVVRGPRLLAGLEPFASDAVAEGLISRGVRILTGTTVESASRQDPRDTGLGRLHGGPVTARTSTGELLVADEILAAAGRRPSLDGLGLEAFLADGSLARPAGHGADWLDGLPEWLHVIGDAGRGAPLTHMGKYEARVLGSILAGADESSAPEEVPVPQVVFTLPQVATVGLTRHRALERLGVDRVITSQVAITSAAGAALLQDDASGGAILVVDAATGCVLGAAFVGPETSELVHAATIAIVGEVPVSRLRHAVPAYPTVSEVWLRLLEQLPAHLR